MQSACAIFSSAAFPLVPYFSTSHKRHYLREKCFWFWYSIQLLPETVLILRRIERGIIVNVRSSLYSCQILMKLEFSRQIFEINPPISNFLKIVSVGAEMFHADGRTDRRAKLMVFFAILRTRLKTMHSSHVVYVCDSYRSHNKQLRFPYAALIGFCNRDGMFTARYELNIWI